MKIGILFQFYSYNSLDSIFRVQNVAIYTPFLRKIAIFWKMCFDKYHVCNTMTKSKPLENLD